MEIKIRTEKPEAISTDALVTYVFDGDDRISGVLSNLDQLTKGKIAPLAKSGEITGKALEMVLLHYPEGIAAQRLLLVGAGKRDKTSLADLRRVAGSALRYLKARGVKNFVFLARESDNGPAQLQAVHEEPLASERKAIPAKLRAGAYDRRPSGPRAAGARFPPP